MNYRITNDKETENNRTFSFTKWNNQELEPHIKCITIINVSGNKGMNNCFKI